MRVSTLPAPPAMVRRGFLFFSALRPRSKCLHRPAAKRLRDAETDSAIAAGDDGDAAGEVENVNARFHEAFPFALARVKAASGGGRLSCTTMDKRALKINMGSRYRIPTHPR